MNEIEICNVVCRSIFESKGWEVEEGTDFSTCTHYEEVYAYRLSENIVSDLIDDGLLIVQE